MPDRLTKGTQAAGGDGEAQPASAPSPAEYRGIRGAGSAVRAARLAEELRRRPFGLQERMVNAVRPAQGHAGQDTGPAALPARAKAQPDAAPVQARTAAGEPARAASAPDQEQVSRVTAGPAALTGLSELVDTSAMRTRGEAMAVSGKPGPAPAAVPVANIFEAARMAQDQEQQDRAQVSLEQARAQATAQRLPTRRKVASTLPARTDADFAGAEFGEAPQSNVEGFFSFLTSIVRRGDNEQRADRSLLSMLRDLLGGRNRLGERSMTMGNQGLFAALDAPLQGLRPEDIQYAGDVDAAYSRRPKFGARFLSLTIVIFFGVLLVWAGFSEIDEVTHSEGSVVGSQSTQTISNLEGGILRAVLVRDGATVQKGDVLAQIDNEMAASSYRDAMQRSMDNVFALIRLEAELRNEAPVFPQDLYAWSREYFGRDIDPSMLQQAQQIIADQNILYRSRKERFEIDERVLRSQVAQREREIQEQTTHREQLLQSLKLSRQQRDAAKALVSRNNFSKLEYLGMEQKVVELQGQADMLATSISRARDAVAEAEHRIESHVAEFRTGITEEINKRRVELTTLQETLSAGGDRVTRTDVRSPVRGIIKQIYLNTVGGVVKPGEPIMDIVPLDDTLLVESRVRPQDVAFLRPGQSVMVKVTAYDFSIYGGLEGKLEQISADTIEGRQGEFYYLAKIRTEKTFLEHNNEILPIIPGMIVQADILTGKKTILQYLMKPILKAKQNALTER